METSPWLSHFTALQVICSGSAGEVVWRDGSDQLWLGIREDLALRWVVRELVTKLQP